MKRKSSRPPERRASKSRAEPASKRTLAEAPRTSRANAASSPGARPKGSVKPSPTTVDRSLQHLATLWTALLRDRLAQDEGAPLVGAVRLSLEPTGATVGIQLDRGEARPCAASALRGPTLLALEGSLEGQRAFFAGGFAAAVAAGRVRVRAKPELLGLMGVA